MPSSGFTGDSAGNAFPYPYTGAGGNTAATEWTFGVAASLAADATWEFRFPMPEVIPAGQLKLRILALANAATGNALFTVQDARVSAGGNPSSVTLTSESQTTMTWASGDADQYKQAKINLSAAVVSNDMLVLAITFNHTSWTLAQIFAFIPLIVLE